jgi:DNA-directed RNA polymerase subunit M/transcription elongation factor TFIIS
MDNVSSEVETSEENKTNILSKTRQKGNMSLSKYLPPNISSELEKYVYNFVIQYITYNNLDKNFFKSVYRSKINDLTFNLNPQNSASLLIDILNKKIKLETVPYMQSNDLNPLLWASIIKKRDFIEFKKNNMTTSDAYQCRRCKLRKCKVYLLQTRSADEPMTIFVQCENCNCTFKIYN